MQYTKENLIKMIKYQEKHGKRHGEPFTTWVLQKRSINIAFTVIFSVEKMDFEDFELALYFRCDDPKYLRFIRTYESQMEEAILHPDRFLENLHAFYLENCLYIEKNHLYREFFDFSQLIGEQRRKKILEGKKAIFDAYYSLLMQQALYFSRNCLEASVNGITDSGELIFCKNPHPFIDLGSYHLEEHILKCIREKKDLDTEKVFKAYQPYGYDIRDLEEVYRLESISRVYDNNCYIMIPYISDKSSKLIIQEPYKQHAPDFPRKWKKTEFYKERLMHRNYMLPSNGITAVYQNAGDIKEIFFQEIFYQAMLRKK